MPGRTTVDRIEQRAAAAPYQDGLLELVQAGLFLGIALVWAAGRGEVLGLLALPIIVVGGLALRRAKRMVTEPRIGYAEPRPRARTSARSTAVFFGFGVVLLIGAAMLSSDPGAVASWVRWAPFLSGYLIAGGYVYLADASGLVRYRVLAAGSVVAGTAASLVSDGSSFQPVALYFLIMSVVLAALGGVALAAFVTRHRRSGDDDAEDAAGQP